jgi:DNA-binding MarR family transcriptional regulator
MLEQPDSHIGRSLRNRKLGYKQNAACAFQGIALHQGIALQKTATLHTARPVSQSDVDLDASTQTLIAILANRLTRNISLYCRRHHKIGSIEQRILMLLRKRDHLSSSKIAELTDLDKAAVSRSLTTLQSRGLVDLKSIHHESRIKLIVLTPKGIQTASELFEAIGKRHSELFKGFTETQRQSFRLAIQQLIILSSEPAFTSIGQKKPKRADRSTPKKRSK